MARVPGLVSLLFWHPVPSSFPGSGWGLSPYSFGILIHHHFLVPARVPGLVSLFFWHCVARVPGLVSLLFWHHFLVPARVPGLVSLLFRHSVQGSGDCLHSLLAFCSIFISWFRLGFRGLSNMSRKRIVFHRDFLAPSGSGLGFRGLSPLFLSFLFSGMGHPMNSLLRMNVVETWFVAVLGSMLV